ncbi:MAG: type 1 glutamine amidotransferase [Steroidobacteraceae bacterium]
MGVARVLVIDGNRAETRARQVAAGGQPSGEGYVATLRQLHPGLHCDIVRPADGAVQLPAALADYDGVAVTGSALNIYDGGAHIERQVELARAVFAAGVPFFGSCWGLQLAVVAAGGVVRANPRGREFGFGRRIALTAAGRAHPMFGGKPEVFEAVTVHRDEIATLPAGSVELAGNEMGLQAAEIRHGRGVCWGVQYHPEYDCNEIAAVGLRYGDTLVQEGLFASRAELEAWAAELRALQQAPADPRLLWRHGLGPAMRDPALKLAEIANWLGREVLPARARRG